MYTECKAIGRSIKQLVDSKDLEHIQMTEVPDAYPTTIKSRVGGKYKFYSNLLQITVRQHGMIFDLESQQVKEVDSIENIDMLQDPDNMVNTGFIMSTSTNDTWEDQELLRRK